MTIEEARVLADAVITETQTPEWKTVHLPNLKQFLLDGEGHLCINMVQMWMQRLALNATTMLQGLPTEDAWLLRAWIQFRFLENL